MPFTKQDCPHRCQGGPALTRPAGRPKDAAKALAILDAGWALFLERGVEATPVEAIAARAGVSKVTLYRHYPDKAALFEAAVRREMDGIERAQALAGPDEATANVAERLQAFGIGIMAFLASKPAVDFYSVVAGELRRHPALARAFYDLGPGRTRANLGALIADAAGRGELAVPDPDQAAQELFGLWQGLTNFEFALGIGADAIRTDLPGRVERGVAAFMRLYGAGQGTGPAQ